MKIRKSMKSDAEILLSMLNYNIFDNQVNREDFYKIYSQQQENFRIIIYKNIRIGMIFDEQIFVNPLYWERIDFNELVLLFGDGV